MSKPLHIIFCGTPDFAVPTLQALMNDTTFVVDLVVTQPDKPVGRNLVPTPPPVKLIAEQHNIPVLQPMDINEEFSILNSQFSIPAFLVVVAYGHILSEQLLRLPSVAPVNVHASLLPRWRGASPIQHAILSGDAETGVTVQKMVEALDAGPILAQIATPIEERETFETLHDRLARLSATLLLATLKKPLKPQPQDEAKVTICRKLTRNDGKVDPTSMTAEDIDRHVRALVPWPGVVCPIDNATSKLLKTNLNATEDALPLPCAGNSTLYVEELQPSGGRPMSGAEWARGKRGNK